MLRQLLERDYARSTYGSIVSNARQNSEHESHVSNSRQGSQTSRTSQKKAEVAIQLAAKRVAVKREKEIAEQKRVLTQQKSKAEMELLAQQDKITMLEAQRDIETMEAVYNAYTEEEFKWNAEREKNGEIITQPKDKDSSASDGDKGSRESKRPVECICCKEKHFIYKSEKFTAMSQEEKKRQRPQLPNNKYLAVVRARHLKRKLEKNPKYKEDYVKFMDGVFKDGDAEETDGSPKEGNTWYIPHHGCTTP
ncbi:hypothetical protein AAFF_G00298790 [Aldrovandia affinis]|uniref:Uncharacterized protein n=1 Tax=Aldrovandia affinis TaxID=143900 RepID=A0AAD7W115_9TELE|nr:hypothetical protein AAFF_G00298790 [Aldrovandia affinis]